MHLQTPVLRRVLHVPVLHVFTCCRPKAAWGAACVYWAWVPPLEDGDRQDMHLHAPVIFLGGKTKIPAADLVATHTHTDRHRGL